MPDGPLPGSLYLRLSITDRCGLRCIYCRPDESNECAPPSRLTTDEIVAVVGRLREQHGLAKVRITGGEPTARRELVEIVRRLRVMDDDLESALTSNGTALDRLAGPLAAAGLNRVNISLDTLDRNRFRRIAGVDGLDDVIAGIDAARDAGLGPVKINTVVLRGLNDQELPQLMSFAADRGCEIRFIEMMPMGPLADRWQELFVPVMQMQRVLNNFIDRRRPQPSGPAPAKSFDVTLHDGRAATIGFLTPMTCSFCSACNRIRLASDGSLYSCLMGEPVASVLPTVRPTFDPLALDRLLLQTIEQKSPCSPMVGAGTMTQIGG
jgi:cyclic pyranopterin phosphate synthase